MTAACFPRKIGGTVTDENGVALSGVVSCDKGNREWHLLSIVKVNSH